MNIVLEIVYMRLYTGNIFGQVTGAVFKKKQMHWKRKQIKMQICCGFKIQNMADVPFSMVTFFQWIELKNMCHVDPEIYQ